MNTPDYFGSDLTLDFLDQVGIGFVALNPGATLRGLHDSLLRRGTPEIITTLHEEIAVGVAHGYAKATGKPMAVALHDHVGPLHAHMALFNAWADDVPVLVLGGSGPRDAMSRRPWIDWIHTASPSSVAIRDALKWDAEPISAASLVPDLQRAFRAATSWPSGPAFVALDVGVQSAPAARREGSLVPFVPSPPVPPPDDLARLADVLTRSVAPLVVVDRPPPGVMEPLVRLADGLGAGVVDLGSRCSFPTTHWANQTHSSPDILESADVVLLIDPRDPLWAITTRVDGQLRRRTNPDAQVICLGSTASRHTVPVDRAAEEDGIELLVGHAPTTLGMLADLVASASSPNPADVARRRDRLRASWEAGRAAAMADASSLSGADSIHAAQLALELFAAVKGGPWQISHGLLDGWLSRLWDLESETHYLGRSGGEGLGYGLPASVGAALANRSNDTLVVDVQSDGDLLYSIQALWTAAHHDLPLLVVVHDNQGYRRDMIHHRQVAEERGWDGLDNPEGISITAPSVDFAKLAEGFGVEGIGPIKDPGHLRDALDTGVHLVRSEGRPALVQVVTP